MITVSIDPVIFSIGHFMVRWYGVIVAIAIGLGLWVAAWEARRKGLSEDAFSAGVVWGIIAGLAGARLFHVIDHWPHEYAADPVRALYFWEGGLAIWGAVLGGFAALTVFAWCRGLRLGFLADIAAPGLVLGQGIGRVACIITGDAMGKPTTGPFGFAYTNPGAMVPQLGVYYTPMPVYEIVVNLGIFAVLWRLRKRDWPDGLLFLVYLSLYSVERFLLGFTSAYQIIAFGLTQSQLIALVLLAAAIPLIVVLAHRRIRTASENKAYG